MGSSSRRGSPTEGSNHDAGEQRSQSKSPELRKYGKNRIFHVQASLWFELYSSYWGDAHLSLGDVQAAAAMRSKNGRARRNCTEFSVMITCGGRVRDAYSKASAVLEQVEGIADAGATISVSQSAVAALLRRARCSPPRPHSTTRPVACAELRSAHRPAPAQLAASPSLRSRRKLPRVR